MRNSSARQLELDYDSDSSVAQSSVVDGAAAKSAVATGGADFPDFGRYDAAFAASSKIAGRINAANISDAELRELLRERKRLITKKLEGTITRKESNRLEYVRWTLDRIEDARDWHVLEALESSVIRYERLADDLSDLFANLNAKLPTKKR